MARQQEQSFSGQVTQNVALNFLLYLPPDYESRPSWPLILFLHDYAERGSDLELLKRHGLPKRIARGDDFPAIIASPQCPTACFWPEQTLELNALVDHLIASSRVDTQRIYLTGLNMGGYGVWSLASRYPQRFAAMVPVGGGGEWWMMDKLVSVPTWVFHRDMDDVVPLIELKVLVKRIRAAGGQAKITVYAEFQREIWAQTYDNPELYQWMLEQRRS